MDTKRITLMLLLGLTGSFWQCGRDSYNESEGQPIGVDEPDNDQDDPDEESDALAQIKTDTPAGHELKKLLQERQNQSTEGNYSNNPKLVAEKLRKALHEGEEALVVHAVQHAQGLGIDVHTKFEDGYTLLHEAAKEGSLPVFNALVKNNSPEDLLARTHKLNGYNILQLAAMRGHASIIKRFDEIQGISPAQKTQILNSIRPGNRSLLHHAAEKGHLGAVKALLELGADKRRPGPCTSRSWFGAIPQDLAKIGLKKTEKQLKDISLKAQDKTKLEKKRSQYQAIIELLQPSSF